MPTPSTEISPAHQGVIDSFCKLLVEAEGEEHKACRKVFIRWLASVGLQDYQGEFSEEGRHRQ